VSSSGGARLASVLGANVGIGGHPLPHLGGHGRQSIVSGSLANWANRPCKQPRFVGTIVAMRVLAVPKGRLFLVAGIVWCLAGAMVTLVGLPLELRLAPGHLILLPLAAVIFVAFDTFVFSPLVRRHTHRIRSQPEDRLPIWRFFNASSWAVMGVMMGGGMALRLTGVVPDWAIAFFYSGLGLALILAGGRFVRIFVRQPA
jgi:hypothetical protein